MFKTSRRQSPELSVPVKYRPPQAKILNNAEKRHSALIVDRYNTGNYIGVTGRHLDCHCVMGNDRLLSKDTHLIIIHLRHDGTTTMLAILKGNCFNMPLILKV